ncbi:hypothetical protein H1R20_g13457, partial [Candolleomyces eurysporus]
MLAEIAVLAAIFISAVSQSPGLTLASAALALLIQARKEQNALAAKAQERQAKDEATVTELREHLRTLEAELTSISARNRALMEENEGCKTGSRSMKELIHTLSEDIFNARERAVQHNATITGSKETQAKFETTIAELQQRLSTFEAQNQALTEENEDYKTNSLSVKESIRTLSEDLSKAKERGAQHDTAMIALHERNLALQVMVDERDKQIVRLSETSEKAASSTIVLRQELDQKTKEAADWKDLYTNLEPHAARPYQRARWPVPETFEPSLTGIMAAKDQEIARLEDRVSEWHLPRIKGREAPTLKLIHLPPLLLDQSFR